MTRRTFHEYPPDEDPSILLGKDRKRSAEVPALIVDPEACQAAYHDTAIDALNKIRSTTLTRGEIADIKRKAIIHLSSCEQLELYPPHALVDLIEVLLDVPREAQRRVKDREKFRCAVEFKAQNPQATQTALRNALGIDTRTARAWLCSDEFNRAVAGKKEAIERKRAWEQMTEAQKAESVARYQEWVLATHKKAKRLSKKRRGA